MLVFYAVLSGELSYAFLALTMECCKHDAEITEYRYIWIHKITFLVFSISAQAIVVDCSTG